MRCVCVGEKRVHRGAWLGPTWKALEAMKPMPVRALSRGGAGAGLALAGAR